MTHFKIEIQIPRYYNIIKGDENREKIPEVLFYDTYHELLELAGGVNTSPNPIIGAWKCPKSGKVFQEGEHA